VITVARELKKAVQQRMERLVIKLVSSLRLARREKGIGVNVLSFQFKHPFPHSRRFRFVVKLTNHVAVNPTLTVPVIQGFIAVILKPGHAWQKSVLPGKNFATEEAWGIVKATDQIIHT